MAFAFHEDKGKLSLDGRIMNWETVASKTETITISAAGSSYIDQNIGGSNWLNLCANWFEYDVIRVEFMIYNFTYSKDTSASSTLPESTIVIGNSAVLQTTIPANQPETTFTLDLGGYDYRGFSAYFYKARSTEDAGGGGGASFWEADGTEVDPYTSLRPYLHSRAAINGTIELTTFITGYKL